MTATMTFFPLGNADTLRLDLANGHKVLIDCAAMRCADDNNDKRCDLHAELRRDLARADRNYFDVVCITHLDDDHCKDFGDFFWLEQAKKYQSEERVRIRELWVPAAAIVEENLKGDALMVRTEARERLRQGKGIRVFSRPDYLKDWMGKNGFDFEGSKHLMVDAGQLVPGYRKEGPEQAEFFVHSPFGSRQNDQTVIERNEHSVVMQATFREGGSENDSYAILGSDIDYACIDEIVRITRYHGNDDRLKWDLMKLFHHCSYTGIGPDRGVDETEPTEAVKWLFETQGRPKSIIVSPSWSMPVKGTKEDSDTQPPHRQAANYYRRTLQDKSGQFTVTMDTPSKSLPKPFTYEITRFGIGRKIEAPMIAATAAASTPRAG